MEWNECALTFGVAGLGRCASDPDACLWAHGHPKGNYPRIIFLWDTLTALQMWDSMMDIISQMVLRWDRLGPQNEITCSDDFTRWNPPYLIVFYHKLTPFG